MELIKQLNRLAEALEDSNVEYCLGQAKAYRSVVEMLSRVPLMTSLTAQEWERNIPWNGNGVRMYTPRSIS